MRIEPIERDGKQFYGVVGEPESDEDTLSQTLKKLDTHFNQAIKDLATEWVSCIEKIGQKSLADQLLPDGFDQLDPAMSDWLTPDPVRFPAAHQLLSKSPDFQTPNNDGSFQYGNRDPDESLFSDGGSIMHIHVPDDGTWSLIKSGRVTGMSIPESQLEKLRSGWDRIRSGTGDPVPLNTAIMPASRMCATCGHAIKERALLTSTFMGCLC